MGLITVATSEETRTFISKKRSTQDEKLKWSKLIIDKAERLVREKGKFVSAGNMETKPMGVKHNSLEIFYNTPFNKLEPHSGEGYKFILDIWQKAKGKVFSASWEPLEIVTFKRSEWILELFEQ